MQYSIDKTQEKNSLNDSDELDVIIRQVLDRNSHNTSTNSNSSENRFLKDVSNSVEKVDYFNIDVKDDK